MRVLKKAVVDSKVYKKIAGMNRRQIWTVISMTLSIGCAVAAVATYISFKRSLNRAREVAASTPKECVDKKGCQVVCPTEIKRVRKKIECGNEKRVFLATRKPLPLTEGIEDVGIRVWSSEKPQHRQLHAITSGTSVDGVTLRSRKTKTGLVLATMESNGITGLSKELRLCSYGSMTAEEARRARAHLGLF